MTVELSNSTGDTEIDDLLVGIVGIYESTFPQRIRGYYVVGSYGDGTAVPSSDLDIGILFYARLTHTELRQCQDLIHHCNALSHVRLDISSLDESHLTRATASMKAALPIFGDKLAFHTLPLEPIQDKIIRSLFMAVQYMWILRGRADNLYFPLRYPDEDGEFYGYDSFGEYVGGGEFGRGTHLMVNLVTMMTTTINALVLGKQVGTKKESVMTYYYDVDDEWADFVVDVYQFLKEQWHYQIPQHREDRERLRHFCERLIHFENFLLAICRSYILKTLAGHDKICLKYTLDSLERIGYPSGDFSKALRLVYVENDDEAIRCQIERITQKIVSKLGN
ncbi:MAG: nucleotidyltransferase domain-containing protein [Chloroflexi bacterium]|nr:nucleotidyltransferase domain-containing protein [Chloroflexota bacterium]